MSTEARISLGIIIGSTRPVRIGSQVGPWVADRARRLDGVAVDLIDLAEVALPLLDEEQDATTGVYRHPHTRAWSARVDRLDGVVLVTSENNSSFPASLKNALDYLHREWQRKPVGIVGYGGMSSGTRVVAALMPVVTHLGMLPVGSAYLRFRERLDEKGIVRPLPSDDEAVDEVLAAVVELATLLAPATVG
jgi:NAD(P)H-dependent FMN reductase